MRKLIVGLMAVGLLAVAAPAMALDTGMGDPLGLINSGAVIPYVGGGGPFSGNQSFLEVTSPVGGNSQLHLFFFDETCARQGASVGLPMTANDVDVLRIDNISPSIPSSGLMTAAAVDGTGFNLLPLQNPIHARVYWVTADGFVRILEPISLDHGEFPNLVLTWNPLRTAASFFAPLYVGATRTGLILVCPTLDITGVFPSSIDNDSGVGFPYLNPQPPGNGVTALQARIYDDEEKFLRNIESSCQCLTALGVSADLDAIYGDPDPQFGAPFGTYTEIQGSEPGPHAFTGYKAMRFGGTSVEGGLDVFGRLDNANYKSLQGGNGTAQR
jgi:hypothetical protein